MNPSVLYKITLKHLFIKNEKQIGLQFYPNKVLNALVKGLPNVRWSNHFGMAYILNTEANIDLIFNTFRGVAWVNGKHFFGNATGFNDEMITLSDFKNRPKRFGV